uniref:glycerophosphocholine cholinephosphodiesterase n=1 Tax=Clytia hemisphaerica TaxID=252671 RepID=A0A7M5VEI0_9CNID
MFYITILLLAWHGLPWTKSTPMKEKVFLLVFDGFVHDFEKLTTNMPNFQKLASEGVKAKGLIPPFPSSTWPSMNTLSTGLYPESHGIIRNNFFNSDGVRFSWTGDPSNHSNAMFFSQEPIWLSNQKQNGRSSVYYWPGYLAFDEKPHYHNSRITPFGANITTGRQAIDDTFENYEKDPSLNFMVVYVDAPDETGHEHGVTSLEYHDRIENLDKDVLGYLLEKLQGHPELNLIVLADHGQINVNNNRVYFVNDYVPKEMLALYPYGCNSVCALKPSQGHSTAEIIEKLAPLIHTGGFRIFNQESKNPKKRVPQHLHYTQNELIPPLLVLPDPGWILYDESRNKTLNGTYGTHGYDPIACQEMQTIFYASGPAFKKGVTMEPFESVNVYPLLAHLLGIKPRPNNGTLTVFKHVLKDWKPKEDIKLPGKYSKVVYALIFVGGVLLALIGMACIYYTLTFLYRCVCRLSGGRKKRYVKVERSLLEDDEEEDEF